MNAPSTRRDWSAAQYLKFEDERTRPARDLLARVTHEAPRRVVDLGCGPGNSTELLAARWPEAEITGLDSSPDMIDKASMRLPGVRFEQGDAGCWTPDEPVEIVFANALFQWLPDHIAVLERLLGSLPAGGVLAVQMPDNLAEPSHRLMVETAAAMPFGEKLRGAARAPLPPVAAYYDALSPLASRLDIWHTIYNHPLANAAAIVEWVKGTGLKPFVDPLPEGEREAYLETYLEAIAKAYPPMADGRVLLRFPRLFVVAVR